MKTRYPNVTVDKDRHGKLRARFRKTGRKPVYMKTLPDQPGFEAEYKALRDDSGQDLAPRYAPGTVHDLCVRYYKSADFAAKGGADDKRRRRGLIESFRTDFGNDNVSDFSWQHIEAILTARQQKRLNVKGRLVGGEVAAVNLRKQLLRLFAYAKKLKWIGSNPVEESERVGSNRLKGYHSWTEAEICDFKKRHQLGSKARLALEIILWTLQRRGDARLFGPRHIVAGKINFRASKNDADLWLPIAPDLRRAIEAMPAVGLTSYLVTEYGKTFSASGFGNWFRDRCNEAGLLHCSAHGLRKAAAKRAAQAGASQQGLKAAGGWKSDHEVSIYVEGVEREELADITLRRSIERFSDEPSQPD